MRIGVSGASVASFGLLCATQLACGSCPSDAPNVYSTSGTYTGQTSVAAVTTPVSGAVPVTIHTQGFTQHFVGGNCSYNDVSFTISVDDGCDLKADSTSSDFDHDSFVQSDAIIEPGQSCTLMLANGPVTMIVGSGSATIKSSSIDLSLSGNVSTDSDAGAATGYLSWQAQ